MFKHIYGIKSSSFHACVATLGSPWPIVLVGLHGGHLKDQEVDTPIESLGTTQLGDRSHGEKKMEKLSMSVQFCPPTDQTPNDTVPKSFHARCRQSFADFRWRHWRGSLHLNDSVWAPRSLENHMVW